jgi:ectoine hydroxylase-related dioxygenase (phytanoyl-CoA dioxygenase family)
MAGHVIELDAAIERWTDALLEQGYCIIPGLLPRDAIAALDGDLAADFAETPFCRGGFYGARTKRFGRLLVRSPLARELVQHELVLGIVQRVLSPWCDTVQLNLTQALALHPGALPQLPHRDQDMWRGTIGETEYLVNVMWPFTRYTRDNGATVVWPNSHGRRALDPEPPAGEFPVELEPGSALIFLGSTLHGAGGNASGEIRRGAIVSRGSHASAPSDPAQNELSRVNVNGKAACLTATVLVRRRSTFREHPRGDRHPQVRPAPETTPSWRSRVRPEAGLACQISQIV